MKRFIWIIAAILCLIALPGEGKPDDFTGCKISPEEMQQANQSRFSARLTFNKGKLQVHLRDARLYLTEKFCEGCRCQKNAAGALLPVESALPDRLLKRLNTALASLPYIDEAAGAGLFPDESPAELKKPLADHLHQALNKLELTETLRHYTGSYPSFFIKNGLFDQWRSAVLNSREIKEAFSELWKAYGEDDAELFLNDAAGTLNDLFTVSLADLSHTARLGKSELLLMEPGSSPDSSRYSEGLLCFKIADPLAYHTLSDAITPKEEKAQVTAALQAAKLFGLPWSQEEIEAALTDEFADKGYQINTEVGRADQRTMAVFKQRIQFIRFPSLQEDELYKALARILPRQSFYELARNEKSAGSKKYLRRPQPEAIEQSLAIEFKRTSEPQEDEDYPQLSAPDNLLFFNLFSAQRIGAALKEIHYGLKRESSQDDSKIQLALVKTTGKDETQKDSRWNLFWESTLYKICPRNNNHFYGVVEYKPGQGTKFLGGYECFKAGPGKFRVEAGANGSDLGSLSYTGVIPFFGTGPGGLYRRPLFLQVEASRLYERNRILNGLIANERREGGLLQAVLPVLSPAEIRQFDLLVEAQRQTVTLSHADQMKNKYNLTSLELGARYFWDRRSDKHPVTFESIPRIRLGSVAREPLFAVFTWSGSFNLEASRLFEIDLKSRLDCVSQHAPVFELPALGGAETVRGFRQDDALGQRLWSLQPEIRLRARGLLAPVFDPVAGGPSKVRKMLRDSFALAFFTDAGGVYGASASVPGARVGPGLGIRFKCGKMAMLKLDWAYGIGEGVSGKGRSRIYFSFDLPEHPF